MAVRYELERTEAGLTAHLLEKDLAVEVVDPHLNKGAIRGTLTVRRKTRVIHRDTVNLTSERERNKLIKGLASKSVELAEGELLLALDEACRQWISQQETTSHADQELAHQPYQATEQGLVHFKLTAGGEVPVLLTNFTASIVGEVVRDDGLETHRSLELEAQLGGQKHRFDVPASRFQAMGWVTEKLGPSAVVYAGFGIRDHARVAIQVLSCDIPVRSIYTHLGWRVIEDRPYYLHAGGPVGPMGPIPSIGVEPPSALARYTLPQPPGRAETAASIRASMQMLEILPKAVTMPVYCAVWRAPAGPCDFSLHLSGLTGVGKSELAALAQQHYGQTMDARHLPGSWSSTANALEVLAFSAKDALLVVDDFAPEGTSHDVQRLHKEGARLLRAQGNRSGRQRLRADSTLRPEKCPRGLILSTGEDIPRAHSVRARILTLEVPRSMDWNLLTKCQGAAMDGLYAGAFAGYVQWLSRHYSELEDRRQRRIRELRSKEASSSTHRRTSMIEAELIFGLELFLEFAVDADALSSEEADRWMDEGIRALREATSAQAQHLAAVDPVQRFLELLGSAIASGNAHLASLQGDSPEDPSAWGWRRKILGAGLSQHEEWQPQGTCVGWIEDKNIYLNPDSAYRSAELMATGESLTILAKTLWKRMRERNLLATIEPQHNMVRRRLQGQRRRVLHLEVGTLMPEESVPSVPSGHGDDNSGLHGPIQGTDCGSEPAKSVPGAGPEKPTKQGSEEQSGPMGPILKRQGTQEERDTFLEV